MIEFAKGQVRPGFLPDTYVLIVTGRKPYANMQVDLRPLIYLGNRTTGKSRWSGASRALDCPCSPYTVALPLDGVRRSWGGGSWRQRS